jgi:hypothetical protein
MKFLIHRVLSAVKISDEPDKSGNELNDALQKLLSYLGQDDHGQINEFFNGNLIAEWNASPPELRIVLLGQFISFLTHYQWECPPDIEEVDESEDLFLQTERLPDDVANIVDYYSALLEEAEFDLYALCKIFLAEMKVKGYWFDFYLDGSPYALRSL